MRTTSCSLATTYERIGYKSEYVCLHHGMCHLSYGLLEGTETTAGASVSSNVSPPMLHSRIDFSTESILALTLRELHIQVASSIEACVWFGFGSSIFLSQLN